MKSYFNIGLTMCNENRYSNLKYIYLISYVFSYKYLGGAGGNWYKYWSTMSIGLRYSVYKDNFFHAA